MGYSGWEVPFETRRLVVQLLVPRTGLRWAGRRWPGGRWASSALVADHDRLVYVTGSWLQLPRFSSPALYSCLLQWGALGQFPRRFVLV
jgi:hypothetical protein